MQNELDSNGFKTFKMNDSTHVQMLKVQKMWHLYKLLHVFSLNYDKCKMQPISNGFNMTQMYNSTNVPCW
jgi:hypothetical protein